MYSQYRAMFHLLNDYKTNLPHEIKKKFEWYFIYGFIYIIYYISYAYILFIYFLEFYARINQQKQEEENSTSTTTFTTKQKLKVLFDGIPNNKLTTKEDFIWYLKL